MHIVCLDMGGTRLRVGVVEPRPDGAIALLPETLRDFAAPKTWDDVFQAIAQSLAPTDGGFSGVACAVAGPIRDHRVVRTAPNIPWLSDQKDFDLAAWCAERFRTPAIVVNDMEAALAGEVEAGALRRCCWAIMNTLSTGWGGANLYNGVPVAGEPGHLWLGGMGNSARCGCGRARCPEAWYSGGAVRRRVLQAARDLSLQIPADIDPCAFADELASLGTSWARKLYEATAAGIGQIWGSQLNLCPRMEKIVYMGTFGLRALALPFFRDRVREALCERSLFRDLHERIPIVPAEAPHGPLLGAARIFLNDYRIMT